MNRITNKWRLVEIKIWKYKVAYTDIPCNKTYMFSPKCCPRHNKTLRKLQLSKTFSSVESCRLYITKIRLQKWMRKR
jgi:hypothetical protein